MQQPTVLGDARSPRDPTGSPPVGKQEHAAKEEKDLTAQSSVVRSDVNVTLSSSDIGTIASTSGTAWKKEFNLLEEHWQHPSEAFWEIYCSLPVTARPWKIFSRGIQNSSLNKRLHNGIKGRSHKGDNPLVSLLLSLVNNESGS